MRMKRELIDLCEIEEEGVIAQLQNQLQQAAALMQQKDMQIESLAARLGQSDTYAKNLTKEFNEKLNVANKINKNLGDALAIAQSGISEGAAKSKNSRGIAGSDIKAPQVQPTVAQ